MECEQMRIFLMRRRSLMKRESSPNDTFLNLLNLNKLFLNIIHGVMYPFQKTVLVNLDEIVKTEHERTGLVTSLKNIFLGVKTSHFVRRMVFICNESLFLPWKSSSSMNAMYSPFDKLTARLRLCPILNGFFV